MLRLGREANAMLWWLPERTDEDDEEAILLESMPFPIITVKED